MILQGSFACKFAYSHIPGRAYQAASHIALMLPMHTIFFFSLSGRKPHHTVNPCVEEACNEMEPAG